MADIVPSLFGVTPQMYQRQQQDRMDAQALRFAQLDPFQQAQFSISRGANMLGGAIGGALGGQDPELQRITLRQQIAGQLNPNDPASIQQAIAMLQQSGDAEGAMMLQGEFRKLQESGALIEQRKAAAAASTAAAGRERAPPTTSELTNARAIAAAAGPEGSPEYNAAFKKEYERLTAPKDSKEPTTTELTNARAIAAQAGPVGSPEYNAAFAAEYARLTAPKVTTEAKPSIQKLQEYASTLPVGSPQRAQVEAAIKAEGEGRGTKVDVGVKLPAQESEFEKGLGDKQSARVIKSLDAAQDAALILETNQVGRDLLKSGAITGTGADFFVAFNNALSQAGIDFGYADAAANSQAYAAAMGANVGRLIKQFGAGTGLSDADREFAEKMAGGKITLTKAALTRILDINDRAANRVIDRHNESVAPIKTNIPLTVKKPTSNAPKPPAASQIPTTAAPARAAPATAASAPMYARNPQTNQRIMSTDGGKTWNPVR